MGGVFCCFCHEFRCLRVRVLSVYVLCQVIPQSWSIALVQTKLLVQTNSEWN